jgi:AcrR family transcriptional regulator
MSPRPKRTPDATIIEAAARVVAERGAAQTRLADVAAATGFAPATLLQRFGSRAGLLQAVGEAHNARMIQLFAGGSSFYVDRIAAALQQLYFDGHLPFLLAHPDSAPSYSLELRKRIAYGLAAAVEAGELPHCDIAAQARRIQLAYYGVVAAALLERPDDVSGALGSVVHEVLADFM